MSDLTAKFAALEAQLATQAATTGNYIDEVEEKLDFLNAQIDTLNINGAANTRYLLNALSRLDPCATCPPPSITIPPVGEETSAIDADKCKRAQAFIAFMGSATVMLDLASGLGTGTFPSLLLSAYQEVIDASSAYAGMPLISFSEGASLIGSLINYALLNIGRADTLAAQFDTIKAGLLPVLFSSVSAADAQSKYVSYLSSSGLPSDEVDVLTKAGYNGLFSFAFDPGSGIDLTPYDGSICGLPPGCLDFTTDEMVEVTTESGAAIIPDWEKYGITPHNNPGHTNPIWIDGDFANWTYTIVSAPDAVYHEILGVGGSGSTTSTGIIGVSGTITITFVSAAPFELHFCPPE